MADHIVLGEFLDGDSLGFTQCQQGFQEAGLLRGREVNFELGRR